MDKTLRKILERNLDVELEALEDERRAISRLQRELETRMGFRDRAAEAAQVLKRELYADRDYAEAVCILEGCGIPRYQHDEPGRSTGPRPHRFRSAEDVEEMERIQRDG